jgi:hypothetical protein
LKAGFPPAFLLRAIPHLQFDAAMRNEPLPHDRIKA